MIKEAAKYLGANTATRQELINHYNQFCLPQVKKERRYKMGLGDNWCAMFVTTIANKCGASAEQFPYEVSVFYQTQIAKERALFTKEFSIVKENDLIIYDWEGRGVLSHVGFVAGIDGKKIVALEGNIKNTVGYRTISSESRFIAGFIKNPYARQQAASEAQLTALDRVQGLARRTLRGEFGNGLERASRLGADYAAVQNLINSGWRG